MAQEAVQEQPETPVEESPAVPEAKQESFDRDYVAKLREESAKYRTRAQEAEQRVKDFEDAQKSESERLADQLDQVKAERDALAGRTARLQVALEKKLPVELIDRLQGSTPEELAVDAEQLLSLVKPAVEETPQPPPDFDGGARIQSPESKTPEQRHNDLVAQLLTGSKS